MHTTTLTGDVTVLQDAMEIPGLGVLPVNAFLLKGAQPMLVDTGLPHSKDAFLTTLGALLDPADLRWIWISHPDRDHMGALYDLLELAPKARIVTTYAGMGIASIERPFPIDRVHLLNPGQQLDLGDRKLTCLRPPLFDSPVTTGFVDSSTGTVFSSDCFGAPLPSFELAGAANASEVPASDLEQGQRLWASVDSPWICWLDASVFGSALAPWRALDPELLLCTHLPPATGRAGEFLDRLATLPGTAPFEGPDQAALEAMLAGFEPEAAPV
jgi:hypothetical protein